MTTSDYTERATRLLKKHYPTAETFVVLSGPKVQTYGHLALHHRDLDFARECLIAFSKIPRTDDNEFIREVFWKNAVVTFAKCFGRNESRSTLKWNEIYKLDQDRRDYAFIDALRDKHIVHDSNPFSDFRAVAAINPEDMTNIVAGIDCVRFTSAVHNQPDKVIALARLVDLAIAYVAVKAKQTSRDIKSDYEKMPRDQLTALPMVQSPEIKWTDVDKPRRSWKKKR